MKANSNTELTEEYGLGQRGAIPIKPISSYYWV